MTHDEIRLDVPLAASGALTRTAHQAIMEHLAECESCRADYEELRALYHSFSVSGASEAEEDWSGHATMQEQFRTRLHQDLSTQPEIAGRPRRGPQRRFGWVGWVAILVAVMVGGTITWHQHELALKRTQISTFVADSSRIILRGSVSSRRAELYVKGDRVLVMPKHLPKLSAHNVYEGWWIVQGKARPAGRFREAPTFLEMPVKRPIEFAITIEPSGGTKVPTSPVLVAGQIPG